MCDKGWCYYGLNKLDMYCTFYMLLHTYVFLFMYQQLPKMGKAVAE